MSVTHAAGPICGSKAGDWFIQRCMVCGDVLSSGHPSRMAVAAMPGENAAGMMAGVIPQFRAGMLIRVDGNMSQDIGEFENDSKALPNDFCLESVSYTHLTLPTNREV